MKPLESTDEKDVACDYYDIALISGVNWLKSIWTAHNWRFDDRINGKLPVASGLLDEFFFCLLGGYGITYEANLAAFLHLKSLGYLQQSWFNQAIDHEALISTTLSHTQLYSPLGFARSFRYRFPNVKARFLVAAANWLEQTLNWNLDQLKICAPFQARDALITCPGLGYKTASWYLRNIGHGGNLAIVDVHIERIAKERALVPYGLTAQNDYLEIEARLLSACRMVPAPIEVLDLVLWHYSRGDLVEHATGQTRLF